MMWRGCLPHSFQFVLFFPVFYCLSSLGKLMVLSSKWEITYIEMLAYLDILSIFGVSATKLCIFIYSYVHHITL